MEDTTPQASSIACFKDVPPLLSVFLRSIRNTYLQGKTYENLSSSIFTSSGELLTQLGLLMTLLRMMSRMRGAGLDFIIAKCSAEVEDFCYTVRQFTSWMLTGLYFVAFTVFIVD